MSLINFKSYGETMNAGTHFFVISVEWNNGRMSSASWTSGTMTPAPGMTSLDIFESLVQHLLSQRSDVFERRDMRVLHFDVRPNVVVEPAKEV